MRSSYIKNNYGSVFRSLIFVQKPKLVVECGILDGFSLVNIAHALKFNHMERNTRSKFYAYDLFDDYLYKHGNIESITNMITKKGLDNYVEVKKGNAFKVYKNFDDKSIDFLHVDISNHGDKLIIILDLWGKKISDNGMIAFEGGSNERDNVEWMKKYKFPRIRYQLINNPLIYKYWNIQVLDPFPSMTLLFPKRRL